MNEQSSTQAWEVELITPLHIGDGTDLLNNQDYILKPKFIDVYDFETIVESLSDTPGAIDDLAKQIKLDQIFKDYRVSIQPSYRLPVHNHQSPKKFRRFIKNAYGQPFIPGSSLKGAIHTALWTTLDGSRLPDVNRFHDFSQGVEQLGGKDPYCMFIRPLQVSDTIAVEPQENLACEEIKFFNLKGHNQPGWKDFVSKLNKDKHNEAKGVFVECLKPGVKFALQTKLDPFLNYKHIQEAAHIVECRHLKNFAEMFRVINDHSERIATAEQAFFEKYLGNNNISHFYKNLIDKIKEARTGNRSAVIRLAWGSGWRGMTGDWLDTRQLEKVRKEKNLGKFGVPVFPKTRRLAIHPDTQEPSLPLGWIMIREIEKKQFFKQNEVTTRDECKASPEESVVVPAKTPINPEEEFKTRLSLFENRVNKCKSIQGEAQVLVDVVQSATDEKLKKAMAEILKNKALSLPNKAYSKAEKENKNWAVALKNLFNQILPGID